MKVRQSRFVRLVRFMNRNKFMQVAFSRYVWCRKAIGGRWEYWYIECCLSAMWLKWDSSVQGRPCTGRGTPVIEEYVEDNLGKLLSYGNTVM